MAVIHHHCWVITAALALLYQIFEMPELVVRADEWLAEGMDITADGEWTSAVMEFTITSAILPYIIQKHFWGRPELLDYVQAQFAHDDVLGASFRRSGH